MKFTRISVFISFFDVYTVRLRRLSGLLENNLAETHQFYSNFKALSILCTEQ